jgi:hypothetical protein
MDTRQVRAALPDSLLNDYLADDEFMDMFDESVSIDFLGTFFGWLWELFLKHIFSESMMPFWKIIFYIIIIGIFAYFISRFFNISPRSLFYGPKKSLNQETDTAISDQDLKTDTTDKLNLAIENKDYREALRLLFINTLQKLNMKKHIILGRGKTNLEYYRELKDPDLKDGFSQLVLIFDYVWYGEFPLSEERFSGFHNHFNQYQNRLGV